MKQVTMHPFHKRFGNSGPVLLPVIHVETFEQTVRNAERVDKAGYPGFFLINHSSSYRELLDIAGKIHRAFPNLWLGVNCLDLEPERVFSEVKPFISGIWVDSAEIDEQADEQERAGRIAQARKDSGWNGLYFGGVAFKYQRPVTELERAARLAANYVDVVTTSGPGTGRSAPLEKIIRLRAGLEGAPLAIASGITPENVGDYVDIADCFLVATGVSKSFTELDSERLKALQRAVESKGP